MNQSLNYKNPWEESYSEHFLTTINIHTMTQGKIVVFPWVRGYGLDQACVKYTY